MVNMMREHVPQETRIHYVITNGGRAPNVVPDFAEVYYYVRHPTCGSLDGIWGRDRRTRRRARRSAPARRSTSRSSTGGLQRAAQRDLARVQQKACERVGGVTYAAEERASPERLRKTLPPTQRLRSTRWRRGQIAAGTAGGGWRRRSTDVGDVSWRVPTVQLGAATWVPGTPAHSWQAVAAGGTSIGTKGMIVAAKTMALTAAELFQSPATIARPAPSSRSARAELRVRDAAGDQKPALDYRK